MNYLVTWGMTPTPPNKKYKDKILGSQVIEANSLTAAKRKAKSIANNCEKISDAYCDYTRTWIYWHDWETINQTTAKVISSDAASATVYAKNNQHKKYLYTAFIHIEGTQ